MKNFFVRAYCERKEDEDGKPGDPLRFKASTEGMKRDGLTLDQSLWNMENYQKNPVFLWAHDYWGRLPPLGRADARMEGTDMIADVTFDQADEFARQIENKYRNGYLNAVSVGWFDVWRCENCDYMLDRWTAASSDRIKQTCPNCGVELSSEKVRLEYDLLDISGVPVPGDPDALIERQFRALKALLGEETEDGRRETEMSGAKHPVEDEKVQRTKERASHHVIAPHSAEKAEEGVEWDGWDELTKAEGVEQLRGMCAWANPDLKPEKFTYLLPHHLADSGKVVWRGVAAAMSRLLQATTQIPDGDRRGCYNHLARHYKQFGKVAPEFRTLEELEALGEEEWRGMFLEGEDEAEDWDGEIASQVQRTKERASHQDDDALEYFRALNIKLQIMERENA